MSISPLGADASQRWHSLKESRASQSADGSAINRPRPPRGPPAAVSDLGATGPAGVGGDPAAAGGIGSASAKVIADLKSLFIDLQSAASSGLGGHGGGQQPHQPAANPSGTDPAAQPAPKHSGGLLDGLVEALKAYAASSNGKPTETAASLSA